MNTYSSPVRVGIVGATGYAGQELVSLLARHPHARLEAAMSSTADSAARPLPRLNRVWDGAVEPLDTARLARDLDLVFLAVPDQAAADLAPTLVAKGRRVIDLSGAFRIRNTESRARYAEVLDAVTNDREEIVITRAGHEPVVIVSLDDYESLRETAYLMRSPANARRLLDAMERLEAGRGRAHDLVETD